MCKKNWCSALPVACDCHQHEAHDAIREFELRARCGSSPSAALRGAAPVFGWCAMPDGVKPSLVRILSKHHRLAGPSIKLMFRVLKNSRGPGAGLLHARFRVAARGISCSVQIQGGDQLPISIGEDESSAESPAMITFHSLVVYSGGDGLASSSPSNTYPSGRKRVFHSNHSCPLLGAKIDRQGR